MTETIHIANTNIEFEFATSSLDSLELSLSCHSLCLQLQFLPILYAHPEDIVAITAMPNQDALAALQQQIEWWPEGLPKLALLHEISPFQGKLCLSWGPSRQVQAWAKVRQVNYTIPDWMVARLVNSKAFSLRYTCLPEAALLSNEQALLDWLQKIPGYKVLKTCFGLAGQGNWHIADHTPSPELLAFCRKEWENKRPMIAEPWLDRISDLVHNGSFTLIARLNSSEQHVLRQMQKEIIKEPWPVPKRCSLVLKNPFYKNTANTFKAF